MKKKQLRNLRIGVIALSVLCLIFAVVMFSVFVLNTKALVESRVRAPVEVNHRVLFLCSYTPLYFTYDAQIAGLNRGLYPKGIEYDVVYMDAKMYSTREDIVQFHDFLKPRLAGRTDYEAVLLGDDNALLFALEYQEELFKGLPMVFFGINDLELAVRAAKNPLITGFFENTYLDSTLELAMQLFPESKKIVALHDQSAAGRADSQIFLSYRNKYPDYKFIDFDTDSLTQKELISLLEELSPDSLLIYMTCYSDKNGNVYSMLSRTNTVVSHVHVPIFRNYSGGEGLGILGGTYMDFQEQCYQAASTVSAVLAGEDISNIPLETVSPKRTSFDHRLMKQYDLDFSLLPDDTVFYNRTEDFFRHYRRIIPPVLFVAAFLLLIFLSSQISARIERETNSELRASHEELKRSQEQLRYQAEYDEVLNIYNRRTAMEYVRQNFTQSQVYSTVMIDIDGFKDLNENYGHQVADSILQYLVAVFYGLGRDDNWLLARYGGDEFLIVIPKEHLSITSPTTEKILASIRAPIPLGDETIAITASVGVSNSDGITVPEQHIINAELAMYEAKDRGRNGVFVYGDEMKEKLREENKIKAKLLDAFDNDGFFMLYQPQIDSKTKKVNGYEALVRMKEPGIYPGQFIPVAERSGWIWRIGRITTQLVIKQLADWRDAGYELHPVSVNFSSNQLNDNTYIDFVAELLKKYNIPPKYFEVEITEGLFLEKSALADETFKRFKNLGIRLLMDDFGTGYSSLGYLSYIPVDVIKLDKSLVD
ncbi:MAG: EAL domain-containing protein, partial [Treponema sp.]|nr:EAL domain-containing protein [Treponema sp.]